MTKMSCEVIRDLLPTYVEDMASDDTRTLVEEHLEGCAACRDVLESMRADMGDSSRPDADDRHELDFLRRNRKRNVRIVLASVIGALCTIGLVIAMRTFAIGSKTAPGYLASTVSVEGTHLMLDLTPVDSASAVAGTNLEEHDGVVSVSTRSVLVSPLHPGSTRISHDATTPITQVIVNGQVVWADGSEISSVASKVFATRHDYMGDVSANNQTLIALGAHNYLGALQHELHTENEPYGWTIYLQQDITSARLPLLESDMRSFAYVLLGVIGNLDEVSYAYTVDGRELSLTVTSKDASTYFGQNIKDCGSNVRLLDELLDKTGITAMTLG